MGRRVEELPFPVGEELDYRLTFGGAYVGRFEAKVGAPRTHGRSAVIPLFGRARTNALVASFKPFVGRYITMVDPESFLPIGTKTEVTYGDDPRWEDVHFSQDRKTIEASFRSNGREGRRVYRSPHPATDILTLMFWSRLLKLKEGAEACQDVFSARRLWRMTGVVKGISEVRTPVGKRKARQVDLHFIRRPTPGLSKTHPPEFDFTVFLANDAYQTPLEFRFTLEGVSARGRLERWSFGKDPSRWVFEENQTP